MTNEFHTHNHALKMGERDVFLVFFFFIELCRIASNIQKEMSI